MKHKFYGIHVIILFTSLMLHTLRSSAQDNPPVMVKQLNLDEAIKLSLENSNQVKIGNAKTDEADAQYKQAYNNYLPDLKGTASYLRVSNPTVDLKVKLNSSSSASSSPIKVSEASYGMLNASVPIFTGLRVRDNVDAAKYEKSAAQLDVENTKEDVVEGAIVAYSNLYKAYKSVDLVLQNLKEQDQRVIDFINMEQNGLLAHNDLLKAQLQQSNVELTLLDAQNNLHLANTKLNLMLGLPESTTIKPDSNWELPPPDDLGSIVTWEQTAAQNRKDMLSLQMHEKSADKLIKATKGEYYPGLALTGGYIAANIPGLLSITNAINVGVGLQYNIGSIWKTPAKVQQAKARLKELQANENMLQDAVRIEINQAYENCILTRKKIHVYEVAIAQAEENYKVVKDKYKNTLATTTELLDADVAALQARINYAFSKADAIVAYKQLQQAAGVIPRSSR